MFCKGGTAVDRSIWRHKANRVQQDIIRIGHAGLDAPALRAEYLKQLRRVIPTDLAFLGVLDPATLLFTQATLDDYLAQIVPRLTEHEILRDDVNKFSWPVRSDPVGSLSAATRGELGRSPRYREIYVPVGLGDELRAVLRAGDLNWGGICLHRERASPNFSAEEAEFLGRVAPHMAAGLRTSLLLGRALAPAPPDGPGVLMLADDLTPIGSTPAAERWLGEISSHSQPGMSELPAAIFSLAARLQQIDRGEPLAPHLQPHARLRTRTGHWLALHASRLLGQVGRAPLAIIIEPAQPVAIAPLIVQAYELSSRERELTQLVLQGLGTHEISAALHVSVNTVQDHLKAIFQKVGVRSRRELVAQIYARHYQPHLQVESSARAA
jgi:DNA-binding CsgD family transcriptional regulator